MPGLTEEERLALIERVKVMLSESQGDHYADGTVSGLDVLDGLGYDVTEDALEIDLRARKDARLAEELAEVERRATEAKRRAAESRGAYTGRRR